MGVSAQPDIIGQVIADVIRIVIDDDVIIVPEPWARVVIVVRRNLKQIAPNIKPIRAATAQTPNVPRAKAGSEMSMLPGIVEVIVLIIAARIVANPAVIFSMHVGSFRMALLIAVGAMLTLIGWAGRLALLRRSRRTIGTFLASW